ncbi:MAG: hypothetical protein E7569_05610 [Ruminococcaceae bacterium]|nr:hypothetical protein [Oscillospiraceae bacterium]
MVWFVLLVPNSGQKESHVQRGAEGVEGTAGLEGVEGVGGIEGLGGVADQREKRKWKSSGQHLGASIKQSRHTVFVSFPSSPSLSLCRRFFY